MGKAQIHRILSQRKRSKNKNTRRKLLTAYTPDVISNQVEPIAPYQMLRLFVSVILSEDVNNIGNKLKTHTHTAIFKQWHKHNTTCLNYANIHSTKPGMIYTLFGVLLSTLRSCKANISKHRILESVDCFSPQVVRFALMLCLFWISFYLFVTNVTISIAMSVVTWVRRVEAKSCQRAV